MLGLASNIKVAWPLRVYFGRGVRPTWSRARHAGGTAKVCVDWAFVSGVSLVSPYLELIDDYRNGEWERHGRALVGALPCALRQVGPVQQPRGFKVRQQDRDTRETGETLYGHLWPVGVMLTTEQPALKHPRYAGCNQTGQHDERKPGRCLPGVIARGTCCSMSEMHGRPPWWQGAS
jgi:hypothetical protein